MTPVLLPALNEVKGAIYYRPAVSIILPFEPKMSMKCELIHSLKLASGKVEQELKNNYPVWVVELMMDKLTTLVSNLNFSTQKKSIAIYVSPVFEKVLYLDIPVVQKVVINDSFEIRDLVYSKKQLHQYLVLILSGKQSKIFLGKADTLVKIVSDAPDSAYAYINDIPEKVANFSDTSSRKEIVMDKFLHHIDNTLDLILNTYRLPLFLLGPKRILGHFKSFTRHSKAVIEYIHGNYEDTPVQELPETLKPYIKDWEKVVQKNLLNQLEDAAGKKKLGIGIREVWKDARGRNGRLLVVEKDYMCGSQRSSNKGAIYMPSKPYNKFSTIRDAVDDVIQTVLENGGDVEFVDNELLKEYHHIALIKFY
jgi:hypothetical protein